MELTLLRSLSFPSIPTATAIRDCKPKAYYASYPKIGGPFTLKSQEQGREKHGVSFALPETAASVVLAATVVGAAATLLVKTTKTSETSENLSKICEDCGGSGVCAECNGEGFVLKKLSEESAERARMAAKNMATRYTAGLPKKWSYCTKCSSSRSCITCGGSGRLSA
ncbi:PREDICTED: uncharacterized protein LOC104586339 isoform X2 [Nelumbo nucifera]|uniref:Uncharacterized protein LOC104586339 isoform X2 n=1 Tax=Nelumbo nucifera TaxID=4432 RepID=A0A1U7YS37_NELNU|nr:PREDICTED: uncharacterized protein LOC104586339 isoform X2 [Nelumbo nucifera]